MERLCPQCEERTTERRCPRDGYATVPAKLYGGAHDLLIGKVFEERYRVDALIGKGGFGAVYRAMQLAVDRPVALKVLRREIRGDLEQVRRFQYEARAASRLIDPHVLRIFDFGQAEDGTLYLVTELLEGEPLSRRLKRVGALPVEAAVSILCQALRGLAEAHDGGLVHRDLKPDNLFLRQGRAGEELVKILDFGVVKFTADADPLESLTQSGTVLGTPAYMSPEQARGVRVDTRSDLYAMGIILYQMLSGRRPFKGSTPMEVLLDHIRTVPPRVEVVSKQAIPPELGELVHRCLDKDPRKRPESADALRTGLERVLGQLAERRDLDPPIRPGGCAPGGATQPTSESDLVSLRDTASMATPVVRTGPHAPTPTQTARSPAAQAGGRRRLLALVVGLALAIPVVLAVDRNFDQGGHADAEQENGGLGSDETAAEVNAPVAPAPRASSARGAGANVSSSASAGKLHAPSDAAAREVPSATGEAAGASPGPAAGADQGVSPPNGPSGQATASAPHPRAVRNRATETRRPPGEPALDYTVRVRVESSPSATVRDGPHRLGRTPLEVAVPAAGTRRVTLSRRDYLPMHVTLTPGVTTRRVRLTPKPVTPPFIVRPR